MTASTESCMPTSWHIFGPVARNTPIDITQWTDIPPSIVIDGRPLLHHTVQVTTPTFDLAPLLGGAADGRTAIVFVPFAVETTGEYTLGAGADWWFEAAIDGRPILNTLKAGNRKSPASFADFSETISLTAGTHLLTVRHISGTDTSQLSLLIAQSCDYPTLARDHLATHEQATVTRVDFAKPRGRVKPLHGINNGPITFGGLMDLSHFYRELQVPHVRIHDPNWPHPREIDIPQIFRDENADPSDPACYDFSQTDAYIKSIIDVGAKIIYRLGVSIEHTAIKYHTHPPKDFARWAAVCIGIIKHYNHGWANGFHYGITHWEIWNEPDIGDRMWTGTREQFFDLYATAATAIKAFDPTVNVGGFGIAGPSGDIVPEFLAMCRDKQLPLDFLSWHAYACDPKTIEGHTRLIRSLLDHYGFTAAESHLNEWNYGHAWPFDPGKEEFRREMFNNQKNEIGASFSASTLIRLQDAGLDVANQYDGQPINLFCGWFDSYGVPQKTYRAFQAFKALVDLPQRVSTESATHVESLAAYDPQRKRAAILLSKFGHEPDVLHPVNLKNLPEEIDACELKLIDSDHQLETIRIGQISDDRTISVRLRKYSVALLLLRRSAEM